MPNSTKSYDPDETTLINDGPTLLQIRRIARLTLERIRVAETLDQHTLCVSALAVIEETCGRALR